MLVLVPRVSLNKKYKTLRESSCHVNKHLCRAMRSKYDIYTFVHVSACLRDHPPSASNNSNKNNNGQDACARLVASCNAAKSDGCLRDVGASVRVRGRNAAMLLCRRTGNSRVEQGLHDLHGRHLLANAEVAVVSTIVSPLETTGCLIDTSSALRSSSFCGGL